jgi:S1-C subfamily serine protease
MKRPPRDIRRRRIWAILAFTDSETHAMASLRLLPAALILALAVIGAACGGGTQTETSDDVLNVTSTARAFALTATASPSAAPSATPAPTPTSAATTRTCDDPTATARVRPSVVRIEAGRGMGTGVIVGPDLVITAEHVVETVQSVRLALADGRTTSATVLARRPQQDLAILRATTTGLTPAAWGDDRALRPGQPLLALGFALDIPGEPSLTGGRFSAHRTEKGVDLIQTDAPLNPGNSGGPIFTQCGEVVGIVSFGLVEGQGLNFAVAARHARELAANPTAGTSPSPSAAPRSPSPTPRPTPTPTRTPTGLTSPSPSRSPATTQRPAFASPAPRTLPPVPTP